MGGGKRVQLKSNNRNYSQLSQPTLLWVSEARLTGVSSKGGKCAESPPTFIERKMLEKPKEIGREEYSRFGSRIYV